MRFSLYLIGILLSVLVTACTDNDTPSRPFIPPDPVTRSGGVLMPLAVGNEWVYVSHSLNGSGGTFWDDTMRVVGTTTIGGDTWYEVSFSYFRDTLLFRNGAKGLLCYETDSSRLVASYPATERVTFLSYSPFRSWDAHQWLISDAYPVYDTLSIGYEPETNLSCVTYNGHVPNDDSTVYLESYAPDIGLVRFEHSGKNDMFHYTYGTVLRSYTLH